MPHSLFITDTSEWQRPQFSTAISTSSLATRRAIWRSSKTSAVPASSSQNGPRRRICNRSADQSAAEIFRAGIEAVPKTTVEAAQALGYSRAQIYRKVVLPLAVRVTMPAMTNNLVNLVKTTTLAYAIAAPELVYMSAQIWSEQVNVPEMMVLLLITYVAIVGVINQVMQWLEVRMRIPGFGQ